MASDMRSHFPTECSLRRVLISRAAVHLCSEVRKQRVQVNQPDTLCRARATQTSRFHRRAELIRRAWQDQFVHLRAGKSRPRTKRSGFWKPNPFGLNWLDSHSSGNGDRSSCERVLDRICFCHVPVLRNARDTGKQSCCNYKSNSATRTQWHAQAKANMPWRLFAARAAKRSSSSPITSGFRWLW